MRVEGAVEKRAATKARNKLLDIEGTSGEGGGGGSGTSTPAAVIDISGGGGGGRK